MLAAVKRLVRTVTPRPVLRTGLHACDRVLFAFTPRTSFDLRSLASIDNLNLAAMFSDATIADGWRAAHAAIRHVYGDEDKLDGVNPGDRRALYHLVRGLKPPRVLDVGTHVGASALYMALALKAGSPDGRVTTIDICDVNEPAGYWSEAKLPAPPRDIASQLGCNVRFVVDTSLAFMQSTAEKFGLIFLDGDHARRNVYREIAAALPLLMPGGVIVLHDYFPDLKPLFPDGRVVEGPFLGMSRVMTECPAITVMPLGALPWPTKEGTHMTSLAIAVRT